MNDKPNNDNKWKDFLLKSSLPLEQLVAQKLEKKGLRIAGEYPYIRPNEQNINTEFSIDLHAYQSTKSAPKTAFEETVPEENSCIKNLNLLVECKYNYQGIKWVFSPHPRWQVGVGHVITFHNQKKHHYYEIAPNLPTCTRGIELSSTGFDPNTISRGLNQLRYGMPNLILQVATKSTDSKSEIFLLLGLILVTTAELYILKANQQLEDYYSAKSLDEIAEPTSSLVVLQERGPHLQNYCEELIQLRTGKPNNLLKAMPETSITSFRKQYVTAEVEKIIPELSRIIVTNINHLDEILDQVKYIFDTEL